MTQPFRGFPLIAAASMLALGACGANGPLDLDLRDNLGAAFDTTPAVQQRVAQRPQPDNRGVISYPDYQVAIARRGDTMASVAARVGLPAGELATFNGAPTDAPLRQGEVVALPRRVAEPSPATGAETTGPIRPTQTITTTTLEDRANAAINRAESSGTPAPTPSPTRTVEQRVESGTQPQRHQVQRGETAITIARRYGVPLSALAEWNGLDGDMTVRTGSYLIIPVAERVETQESRPGEGTVAPTPPSADEPLPEERATQAPPEETPERETLAAETTSASASAARLVYPVQGSVIRAYAAGRNEGIDIAAPAGTPVKAADAGVVAAITRDTDQVPILVLRHTGNVLTVYANVDNVAVAKGDRVRRGQDVATVRAGDPSFLHFEVREGFESVDPTGYLE